MARIHYYEFPDTVGAHTRYLSGASKIKGKCKINRISCLNCPICSFGWSECTNFEVTVAEYIVEGITITTAKRMLKEYGGRAWTEHYERDGGLFETSPILLRGNNSYVQYNRHL